MKLVILLEKVVMVDRVVVLLVSRRRVASDSVVIQHKMSIFIMALKEAMAIKEAILIRLIVRVVLVEEVQAFPEQIVIVQHRAYLVVMD